MVQAVLVDVLSNIKDLHLLLDQAEYFGHSILDIGAF